MAALARFLACLVRGVGGVGGVGVVGCRWLGGEVHAVVVCC